ncbi:MULTISPECIES: glycosyltransferase family 2 protein [unclassified Micromonospora]|uniref:glycosyltransferase n=1 Tax=unclassified Micromonospora TaxID=2617518 RepID=UPI0009CEBEE7|nr:MULTISPECIES: glycosyltransferase [unclassified Micromonospora]MDI5936658.1 glycosyltransferase [Micromonospora sp. DH15]OON32463.1 hypothetical protein BSA16_05465 [Micromonospora sp. Rc5]
MSKPKISVLIPYRQRLANVRNAFAALADQTLSGPDLQVVIGAIEYSPEYAAVAAEFADRLDIVTVTTGGEWNVSRARNQALPVVTGEVTVSIDVDMILPPRCLETLYRQYFADGHDVCVLGQMLGYDDDLTESDVQVDDVRVPPYEELRQKTLQMEVEGVDKPDDRILVEPLPLIWTLVWGGLAALRTDTIRRHGLTFDEAFGGWGAEDQEWGYRIQATGTPIIMSRDIWGIHLPHRRDAAANQESYQANMRHFLTKSPTLDVELARSFGWDDANRLWEEARREVDSAAGGSTLGVVRGRVDGAEVLAVGALLDKASGQPVDPEVAGWLGQGPYEQVLPLLGLALPYRSGTFAQCRVLPPVHKLAQKYRDAVLREAKRVAEQVG